MGDLAVLGLRIESQEVEAANRRLDSFTTSADSAQRATDLLGAGSDKAHSAIAQLMASIDRTTKEMLELQRAQRLATGAAADQTGATAALTKATADLNAEMAHASTSHLRFGSSFKTTQDGMGGVAAAAGNFGNAVQQADAHVAAYLATLASGEEVHTGAVRSQAELIKSAKDLGAALGRMASDAVTGRASLSGMATNGTRATASLIGLGGRVAVVAGGLGLAAGAATLTAKAWLGAEKSALTLDRAASGLGRTAGLTGAQLDQLAVAAAKQGDVSVRSAQEQAAAYVSTGRIGSEMISRLIADGKDLASFLGKDLPDATRYLATAMGDPARAAVEMTRQFGLLTQAQIEEIKKAQEAGEAYRAQKILMDALSGAAEGHAQKVGVMTSAWSALAKAASDAWNWMGRALYVDESEKLQKIINQRAGYERFMEGSDGQRRGLTRGQQRVYDELGRDGQAILNARASRKAADDQAAANQAAQLRADAAGGGGSTRTGSGSRSGGASSTDRDQANLIRQSQQLIDQMNKEAETYGLNWEQLARYNAEKQIAAMATNGWTQQETLLAASIREATEAMIAHRKEVDGEVLFAMPKIDLKPLDVSVTKLVDELKLIGDELERIDEMAVRTAYGLADAFGRSGRAAGDLLAITSAYAIERNRLDQMERDGMNVDRERAFAQISNYGDMAGAAKDFFREGSEGYRLLQAVEQGYRIFQLAMSVQAMAQNAAETTASVAGSATRGAASAAAGAAKMFEALGPFGFPVVAAMIALLATLGLKGKGGGGGSAPSFDASVASSQGYAETADQARASAAQAVATQVKVQIELNDPMFKARVQQEAVGVAAPMVAAAAAGTKRDVMDTLKNQQVGNRRAMV